MPWKPPLAGFCTGKHDHPDQSQGEAQDGRQGANFTTRVRPLVQVNAKQNAHDESRCIAGSLRQRQESRLGRRLLQVKPSQRRGDHLLQQYARQVLPIINKLCPTAAAVPNLYSYPYPSYPYLSWLPAVPAGKADWMEGKYTWYNGRAWM